MKNIRILGVDDAYFVSHSTGRVKIVGVVMRLSTYIDGFLLRDVEIDGRDSAERIADMFNSKYGKDIHVVMTQGITLGGFNIIDIDVLHSLTRAAVIVVSRKQPDFEAIRDALRSNFEDWKERWELIERYPIEMIENAEGKLWIQRAGISMFEVKEIISKTTIRGVIPEPVRVAHLVASALHFGESKGKP